MLMGIAKEASWDVPASFGINPIASPAALAHWRVHVVVMELLGPEKAEKGVKTLFKKIGPAKSKWPPPREEDPRGGGKSKPQQRSPVSVFNRLGRLGTQTPVGRQVVVRSPPSSLQVCPEHTPPNFPNGRVFS